MTDQTIRMSEPIAKALRHLELALACLDEADELQAPPYVQMAIDLLTGWHDDEAGPVSPARPEPGAVRR